ncbi:MAG TPA: helicase-exonuclease AddAB subunit AddA [Eubacterium sp.]|nr:helicase-exonuclease AddAB subunit AddA [Eubacterium sp.]HCO35612.1 helicase-exonuclease AddAB subunit AddA [Eubacterium sp.]
MRMERKWTPAQKSAIDIRDCNVLVSAAAGSGKTAVLVERIISMITDPDKNIDIDRLVVVTFTKAAAAQMKDKIRKALDSMLDENPGDVNLLRQITLLNNAQITTIDSFCLWIIRNHFPEVNLDPGFRIMDEGEKKLIENDVMEDVLEEFYAEADEEFFNLVDAFGMGRDDSGLVSIIDKIYRFSRSNPWIDEWFDECMLVYDDETYDNPAIKELYDSIKNALLDYRDKYNRLVDICSEPAGPAAYTGALQSDLLGINEMINSQDFGELGRRIRIFSFEALSRKKDAGADPDIKEYVKGQRKLFKDYIGRLNDKIFLKDDEGIFADMQGAGIQIRTLLKVAKVYAKRVSEVKREKGIIDFNDMEHLALSILVKKEDGKLVYTETADKLANRFEEILIDEYQDSNQLQEVILNAVSKTRLSGENNNIYMVGDVKQSIYKFRLACPELFIEKYDTYGETGDNVRIELQKNFRSRENVLECANDVFSHIMNKNFSGIGYDDSVRLNAGFPYPEYSDSNYGDEANKSTDVILISSENEEEATTRELEADRLAKLIEGIVASGVNVYDADENIYRPAEYRDIVILTRSVTGWADTFADALMDRGIPAYTDSSTGYFSVREIQVILSMLTIVDNPVQEISLAAAMMSYFGGFTAADLGLVRKLGREHADKNVHNNLYEHLKVVAALGEAGKMQESDVKQLPGKCALFLAKLTEYRDKSSVESLYDLCWEMIYDSGYYDYVGTMPAGAQRQANLNVLLERAAGYGKSSYSGLFNFLRYIERLKKFDEDFAEGAASLDNENLVRIMSIHKSKGLEFPIVILAGAHKSINFMDATAPVLVDQNLGIAVDYVDLERRTKTPTIIKGAMARRIVRESIAEEERLLYVAMTRAREKLIITGVVKDADKTLDKYRAKSEELATDGTLSYADSENIKNYLDMIMPVCLMDSDKLKGSFKVMVDAVEDSEADADETGNSFETGNVTDIDAVKAGEALDGNNEAGYPSLDELPEYVPADNASGRMKLTVSQLKAMQAEDNSEENAYMDDSVKEAFEKEAYDEQAADNGNRDGQTDSETIAEPSNSIIPKFISGEEVQLAANERGSAYHRVMECLDYSVSVNLDGVKADINRMLETGKMNELQVKSVNPWDINTFVQSDTGRRVANAVNCGSVRREQPFVFEYEGQLIQGIIDLYFEEDGEFVLVDYKTDRVMKGEAGEKELVRRYAIQLDYYAKALTQLTGKKVKEKIIYSFALGKGLSVVNVNNKL